MLLGAVCAVGCCWMLLGAVGCYLSSGQVQRNEKKKLVILMTKIKLVQGNCSLTILLPPFPSILFFLVLSSIRGLKGKKRGIKGLKEKAPTK